MSTRRTNKVSKQPLAFDFFFFLAGFVPSRRLRRGASAKSSTCSTGAGTTFSTTGGTDSSLLSSVL